MSIYSKNGVELFSAYGKDGATLAQAFDVNGNPLLNTQSIPFLAMTYNVQWFSGINANQSMQEEILSRYDPDILGIQELSTSGYMPALGETLFADYDEVHIGTGGNHPCIVTDYPLSNVTTGAFVNQEAPRHAWQKSYFNVGGRTICWINVHLTTSTYESDKVAQAGEVFQMVQNEPYFIVTGDFNTGGGFTTDAPEYTTMMKQFVDAGYHLANFSNQNGFHKTWINGSTESASGAATDNIITSANIDIQSVIVDSSKISVAAETGQKIDHLPLIAELLIR